jgi:glutaredoxin
MMNTKTRLRLLVLVALCCTTLADADIYKWTDAQGQTHFDDRPSGGGKSEVVAPPAVNTYSGTQVRKNQWTPRDETQTPQSRQVVMYGASWCGVCRQARAYFKRNGIPYVEYDVETSDKGRTDYRALHGRGVPIILVGSQRMDGFDAQSFEQMYRAASPPARDASDSA